jgi:DNA-binding transcriptional regulator YiaG
MTRRQEDDDPSIGMRPDGTLVTIEPGQPLPQLWIVTPDGDVLLPEQASYGGLRRAAENFRCIEESRMTAVPAATSTRGSNMTSVYDLLRRRCGLSQQEAADFHKAALGTVKSWCSGRRNAPEGVLAELRTLYAQIERAARNDARLAKLPCQGAQDAARGLAAIVRTDFCSPHRQAR